MARSLLRSSAARHVAGGAIASVLAANLAVLATGLGGASADGAERGGAARVHAGAARAEESVVITLADGSEVTVDPTTPAGQAAIAEAEARGDTIRTVPASEAPGDAAGSRPAATVPAAGRGTGGSSAPRASELTDAVEDAVDDVVEEGGDAARTTPTTQAPGTTPTTEAGGVEEIVEDVVDDVEQTVEDTVDDVEQTVEDTVEDVEDVVDVVEDVVEDGEGIVEEVLDGDDDDVVEDVTDLADGVLSGGTGAVEDVVPGLPAIGGGSGSGGGGLGGLR